MSPVFRINLKLKLIIALAVSGVVSTVDYAVAIARDKSLVTNPLVTTSVLLILGGAIEAVERGIDSGDDDPESVDLGAWLRVHLGAIPPGTSQAQDALKSAALVCMMQSGEHASLEDYGISDLPNSIGHPLHSSVHVRQEAPSSSTELQDQTTLQAQRLDLEQTYRDTPPTGWVSTESHSPPAFNENLQSCVSEDDDLGTLVEEWWRNEPTPQSRTEVNVYRPQDEGPNGGLLPT